MKLTIIIDDFPMSLAPQFTDEIRKYAEVAIAFTGHGTATVHMDSKDIVKIQEVSIIANKYSIGADADISEKLKG